MFFARFEKAVELACLEGRNRARPPPRDGAAGLAGGSVAPEAGTAARHDGRPAARHGGRSPIGRLGNPVVGHRSCRTMVPHHAVGRRGTRTAGGTARRAQRHQRRGGPHPAGAPQPQCRPDRPGPRAYRRHSRRLRGGAGGGGPVVPAALFRRRDPGRRPSPAAPAWEISWARAGAAGRRPPRAAPAHSSALEIKECPPRCRAVWGP